MRMVRHDQAQNVSVSIDAKRRSLKSGFMPRGVLRTSFLTGHTVRSGIDFFRNQMAIHRNFRLGSSGVLMRACESQSVPYCLTSSGARLSCSAKFLSSKRICALMLRGRLQGKHRPLASKGCLKVSWVFSYDHMQNSREKLSLSC